jgi:hypothetical protein
MAYKRFLGRERERERERELPILLTKIYCSLLLSITPTHQSTACAYGC